MQLFHPQLLLPVPLLLLLMLLLPLLLLPLLHVLLMLLLPCCSSLAVLPLLLFLCCFFFFCYCSSFVYCYCISSIFCFCFSAAPSLPLCYFSIYFSDQPNCPEVPIHVRKWRWPLSFRTLSKHVDGLPVHEAKYKCFANQLICRHAGIHRQIMNFTHYEVNRWHCHCLRSENVRILPTLENPELVAYFCCVKPVAKEALGGRWTEGCVKRTSVSYKGTGPESRGGLHPRQATLVHKPWQRQVVATGKPPVRPGCLHGRLYKAFGERPRALGYRFGNI
jgi:hypothetical protein